MAERREDTFIDTLKSADFTAVYENDKVTLSTVDSRVIKVHFHDTYHWKHLTSWNCTPCPDKCYLHLSNTELSRQLRALKEEVDTGDRHLMNIDGPLVFKFEHNTDDDARQMVAQNKKIGNTFKQFLQKIDSQVKYITMAATVGRTTGPVSQAAALPVSQGTVTPFNTGMSDSSTAVHSNVAGQVNAKDFYQGHTTNYEFSLLTFMFVTNDSSGNSACHTRWATIHKTGKRTLQPTISDFRSLWTQTKELFHASLEACWSGSMVFCFEHESREDAINMIIRHAQVKEVILHFLQELDPSIEDVRMEVKLRDVSESEEQTSETRPGGTAGPEHKDEEGAARSHPEQKDDDETCDPHIQEKDDVGSSLPHSLQKEERGSGSHSSGYSSGSHSSGYTSSDPSLKPLGQGQDSDRHASSDPSQGQSRSERDPRLSTASHVIPSPAGRDLYYDSRAGDLEEVKRLLSTPGVDVNSRWWSQTPVMEAAVRGHREVVELLVKEGADVSLVDEDGNNILHLACQRGDVEIVKYVLSLHVVDINSRGRWGSLTPVMAAAWCRHRDVVELLVKEGADVSLVDEDGNNILHLACRRGDVEMVKYVLSLHVVDINSRGWGSMTPVMAAAVRGHREVVELLVKEGADVSLVDEDGNNILHLACRRGDVEMVKYVLSLHVVDINSRGGGSWTPVMEAAVRRHRDMVELLVKEGADVSLVDGVGNNILHLACQGGDVETVQYVLSLHVVDINSRGWWSRTPVMEAARRGHRDMVELLVKEGADVSLVDEDGNNILHWACRGGDVETVQYVLSLHVVDIDARNKSGRTAADEARLGGHQPVVKLLKSRGAQ